MVVETTDEDNIPQGDYEEWKEIKSYEQNPGGNTSMVSRDVGMKMKSPPVRESTLWVVMHFLDTRGYSYSYYNY